MGIKQWEMSDTLATHETRPPRCAISKVSQITRETKMTNCVVSCSVDNTGHIYILYKLQGGSAQNKTTMSLITERGVELPWGFCLKTLALQWCRVLQENWVSLGCGPPVASHTQSTDTVSLPLSFPVSSAHTRNTDKNTNGCLFVQKP